MRLVDYYDDINDDQKARRYNYALHWRKIETNPNIQRFEAISGPGSEICRNFARIYVGIREREEGQPHSRIGRKVRRIFPHSSNVFLLGLCLYNETNNRRYARVARGTKRVFAG
jgi:hypothetical protein